MATSSDMDSKLNSGLYDGFVLESADSVRFGDEYTPEERERNRQILFGQLLCGLLMGEPVWTNAVFAFDSAGMVQVLGAIARAFHRDRSGLEQHLPMIIAAYGSDTPPGESKPREWANPNEFFLRCYAHRLGNTAGFTMSALPLLCKDGDRRINLANKLIQHAESSKPCIVDDLRGQLKSDEEISHFRDLYSIDEFLRSWYGAQGATRNFSEYAGGSQQHSRPVRLIRDWTKDQPRFTDFDVKHLRRYCDKALEIAVGIETKDVFFEEARDVLAEELKNTGNPAFKNRSEFRKKFKTLCSANAYKILVELADGHYVRLQYTELTRSAREVTSPAENDPASNLGEKWANATMRSWMKEPGTVQSWQFITKLKARPNASAGVLNLDEIARRFADYMTHPDRRHELSKYQRLLALARDSQVGSDLDTRKHRFDALHHRVNLCCDAINTHMNGVDVHFAFNPLTTHSLTGSLTMSYYENDAISQATGDADAPIDPAPSPQKPVCHGSDNALGSTPSKS